MKDCCRSIDILITGLVPRCHHRETQGSPDVEGFYRLCIHNDFQECSELSVVDAHVFQIPHKRASKFSNSVW